MILIVVHITFFSNIFQKMLYGQESYILKLTSKYAVGTNVKQI